MEEQTHQFQLGPKTRFLAANAKHFTCQEVRKFIQLKYPDAFKVIAGPVAKELSAEKSAELDKMSLKDLLLTYRFAVDVIKTPIVTPFNAGTILRDQGYKCEVTTVVEELGLTKDTGKGGVSFPRKDVFYLKFSREDNFFYCPIVDSLINMNFVVLPGLDIKYFVKEIASLCASFGTFFSMKNGKVNFNEASEAGLKLLNFEGLIASEARGSTAVALTEVFTSSLCPDVGGWSKCNLHGFQFCHTLYVAISDKLADYARQKKEGIIPVDNILDDLTEMAGVFRGSQLPNYFYLAGSVMALDYPELTLPRNLNNQVMNVFKHSVSLAQAQTALHLSRSFRGKDKGVKGAFSRGAYLPFLVDPSMAEVVYLSTNLSRFLDKSKDIILNPGLGKGVGMVTQFLEALEVLDYGGSVMTNNSPSLMPYLKHIMDRRYKFSEAKFEVILVSNVINFCVNKKAEGILKSPIIYDFASGGDKTFSQKTILEYNDHLKNIFEERLSAWADYSYPVLARVSMFDDLLTTDYKLSVVSNAEIHNLVAWVSNKFSLTEKVDRWWYDLTNPTERDAYLSAAVLCNVLKSMRHHFRQCPSVLLKKFQFKVPQLVISLLGKQSMHVQVWKKVDYGALINRNPTELLLFFKENATISEQYAILKDETLASRIFNGVESKDKKKEDEAIIDRVNLGESSSVNVLDSFL